MGKALKPPAPQRKRDDLSDELSKMFDDGTVLESEKTQASSANSGHIGDLASPPRLASAQPTSAHLGSPQPSQLRRGSNKRQKAPVAADRDFNRRPNSLDRDALPAGLFPGTSKKLYDALFLRTRGAHQPTRTIQARRTELMKWAGIGSRNTFLSHMRHLTRIGLVIRRFEVGDNEGAEYEICIPEEIDLRRLEASAQLTSAQLGSAQELVLGSAQKVGRAEVGQNIDKTSDYSSPNTFYKTNTIDDEKAIALSDLHSILAEAAQKLTGRAPKATEREQWAELARVIADELHAAATRTGSVSSVPAFLSEHLRRKFAQRATERKRAGKRAAPVEEQSAAPATGPVPELRLTPEEIAEQARLIAELLESGYTIEQAEAQFSGGVHPEDWAAIREAAAELKEKGTNTSA